MYFLRKPKNVEKKKDIWYKNKKNKPLPTEATDRVIFMPTMKTDGPQCNIIFLCLHSPVGNHSLLWHFHLHLTF